MTWFSRLVSNDRKASRRMINRRRRMMNLERLESRMVLSTVTVDPVTANGTLVIHGDTANDNFQIIEQKNGHVTVRSGNLIVVPGVGVVPGSSINGGPKYNSNNPVTNIVVDLPGTNNFDFVTLADNQNKTVHNVTVTAHAPNLNFSANKVTNSGNLVISDLATTAVNGVLHATVTNSSFATMSITQEGNGPDASNVFLQNDRVPGPVYVSLGDASGDSIVALDNTFGPTTFLEGNGNNGQAPADPTYDDANGDWIYVNGGQYKSLYAEQLLDGIADFIGIYNIQVAGFGVLPAGVTTVQHNGAFDITDIDNVTTFGPTPPINFPLPPGIGVANIDVTQGNGSVGLTKVNAGGVNDHANVSNSSVPGYISISQSDVDTNTPMYNVATIQGDTAGSYLSIIQGNAGGWFNPDNGALTPGDYAKIGASTAGGSATIFQGTGWNDYASIDPTVIGGDASITQNDQAGNPGDQAYITGTTDDFMSIGGNATISQGAAYGDLAVIAFANIGGNAAITQQDQAGYPGDTAIISGTSDLYMSIGGTATIGQGDANGDVGVIKYATIGSNIGITQGDGNGDAAEIEDVVDNTGTSISILQGNGNGDVAAIVGLTANGGGLDPLTSVEISITQGTGSGDFAEVADVYAPYGNITISQSDVGTNPVGDTAVVLYVTIGSVGPNNSDIFGNVTISQGDAPGDVALVEDSAVNNVDITQGANVQTYNGSTVALDIAEVNDVTVLSDITITQGNANSDGLYVAAIANDFVGLYDPVALPIVPGAFTPLVTPPVGSSTVSAGGITAIQQFGGSNVVLLGDTSGVDEGGPAYFYTTFLDVYTGDGGGSYVQVLKTFTFGVYPFLGGPFSTIYNIAGGGTGNSIHIDKYSRATVTFDPDAFSNV